MTSPNYEAIAVAKLIKSAEKVATISSISTATSEIKVFFTNYLLKTIVELKIYLGSFSFVNYSNL